MTGLLNSKTVGKKKIIGIFFVHDSRCVPNDAKEGVLFSSGTRFIFVPQIGFSEREVINSENVKDLRGKKKWCTSIPSTNTDIE